MGYAQIRAQVASILSSVPGMGVVHQYERYAADYSAFLSLFKHQDKINGWVITRRGVPTRLAAHQVEDREHQLLLRGYYGLADSAASEHTFQQLVEDVQDAFKHDLTLGGACLKAGPVQVDVIEPRLFGTVLCHVAELSLSVRERLGP